MQCKSTVRLNMMNCIVFSIYLPSKGDIFYSSLITNMNVCTTRYGDKLISKIGDQRSICQDHHQWSRSHKISRSTTWSRSWRSKIMIFLQLCHIHGVDVVGLKGKERKKELWRKISLKENIVFPNFTESHSFLYLCCAGYHICAGYRKLGTALTN